ncbi:MAG: bacillithiol system redox-active protein YtxJ [Saprospiraceae bacterium]
MVNSAVWLDLSGNDDLQELLSRSQNIPCLIFKHSTQCSISAMALLRLESRLKSSSIAFSPYKLLLLEHRAISNEIAQMFKVHHESPQVLLIYQGICIYDEDHLDISFDEIEESVASLNIVAEGIV